MNLNFKKLSLKLNFPCHENHLNTVAYQTKLVELRKMKSLQFFINLKTVREKLILLCEVVV